MTAHGIRPNTKLKSKVKAVLEYPGPKNVKSFLGRSGYYRKFIKSYSSIAKPIMTLLHKNVKFEWTEKCEKSFGT